MMFTINEQDREYIENKYHFTSQPFSPYNFRAYHGGEYDLSTGLSDEKMKEGLGKIAEQFKDKEHALSKAKQIEFVLDNTPVDVNEKDWFVGIYSWTRITVPTTSDIWKEEVFQKENAVKEAIDSFRALNLATIYPDYDHSIPDWDAVIALGFKGLLDRVKLYRQKNDKIESDALFDAMEIVYSAILRLLKRLEEYALSHPSKKSELQARCLKSLQNGAPTDTYEALQLIYLYHLIGECVDCYQVRSLASGLDRTLTPFYRNDLKTKRYERGNILTLNIIVVAGERGRQHQRIANAPLPGRLHKGKICGTGGVHTSLCLTLSGGELIDVVECVVVVTCSGIEP